MPDRDPGAHPAVRLPGGGPWIDVPLPAWQDALVYDRLVQSRIDAHILKLMRLGDTAAADAMYNISLGFVAAHSEFQPRVFWQLCAACFQALCLGLCTVDAAAKHALSGILLQYRALAAGEAVVSENLLHELLAFLVKVDPLAAAQAPVLAALLQAYARSAAESPPALEWLDAASPEADSGAAELEDQIKVIGTLHIDIAVFNAYLNESDEWSRRLFVELSEWALELHRPLAQSTLELAHALAAASAGVGLQALSELAGALERALRHVQGHAPGRPQQVKVFLEAAEDIRRLLHQFAAGFLKPPEPQLLSALEEISQFEFPPAALDASDAAAALPHGFAEQAAPLLLQLGGALRQWQARPDNVGARNEALRVLQTLEKSAEVAGALRVGEMSRRLISDIEQVGTQPLQSAQLESLSAAFATLKAGLDPAHTAGG